MAQAPSTLTNAAKASVTPNLTRAPYTKRLLLVTLLSVTGCNQDDVSSQSKDEAGFTAPTPFTVQHQQTAKSALPKDDDQDLKDATRGLIAREDTLAITTTNGEESFNQEGYRFLQDEAPASVHPSLWRQARLNTQHGLYEVAEGIYQVRGYDLANMSIIKGKTGWIIVDPLTTEETAAAAMRLIGKHLGERPVAAIIFTHSHIDHFGGAQAIASPRQVAEKNIRVIAPTGFMEEATSENALAGPAMSRRAIYMYGRDLPRSARGKVDNGLGKEPANGTMGILAPTELIGQTPTALNIDGVDFIFQYTPGSEAPAELTFYLPDQKAFCGAEVLSRTLHNLYTLRGAKVRDAQRWSGYIDEAMDRFGDTDVMFFSHHWPVWGRPRIQALLADQRDTYQFIHDQTLRLANQGYGPEEIAEQITLPASLQKHFWNRDYYGTVKHNVKAVYQMYFGWYDGNPAHLDPLPRKERAKRYVDFMGGAHAVLTQAQQSFNEGDYRWVAEVMNHLVSAHPENDRARELLARTYDQMGYQSESSAWRNVYLSAAFELRHGATRKPVRLANASKLLEQTRPAQFLQMLQAALNAEKAEGLDLMLNLQFADLQENYVVHVNNSVLHFRQAAPTPLANATLIISRPLMVKLITGTLGIEDILGSDELSVAGSKLDLIHFFSLLDKPNPVFPIVTPNT